MDSPKVKRPLLEYPEPLKGFRLEAGAFEAMDEPRRELDALVLASEVLGLELVARGETLRLRDPATGNVLPVARELPGLLEEERRRAEAQTQRAEAERQRAETERRRAEAAEADLVRLRAELSRLQREGGE